MSNETTDPRIKDAIDKFGIAMICILPNTTCSCSEDLSHEHVLVYDKLEAGYVYTVGHREHNRPDIVAYCGPGNGESMLTGPEIETNIHDVATTINRIVKHWSENPVRSGNTVLTDKGRVYIVQDNKEALAACKFEHTVKATEYYGDDNYELLFMIPFTKLAGNA